jgi:hypothetical protein
VFLLFFLGLNAKGAYTLSENEFEENSYMKEEDDPAQQKRHLPECDYDPLARRFLCNCETIKKGEKNDKPASDKVP